MVKFRSGRYRRLWVDNVVAIGNAAGFVEPLEATALMMVTLQCENLVTMLEHTALRPTPTLRDAYNKRMGEAFDVIRDFLALHYKLNTRLDNPFWHHCREDTDMGGLVPLLEFYRENGPSIGAQACVPSSAYLFGLAGYFAMLVGNRAPYAARHQPTQAERMTWEQNVALLRRQAQQGFSVEEILRFTRSPQWKWNS